jgi:hypothetical protein
MPTPRPSDESVSASVSNVSGGNIAIGHTVHQTSQVGAAPEAVTPQELADLKQQFADLRGRLLDDADVPDEAAEKLDQLEQAVTAATPDVGAMERIRNWFFNHAPKVAGSVLALVVNPIVGSLVAAAGDAVSSEFRKRFVDE